MDIYTYRRWKDSIPSFKLDKGWKITPLIFIEIGRIAGFKVNANGFDFILYLEQETKNGAYVAYWTVYPECKLWQYIPPQMFEIWESDRIVDFIRKVSKEATKITKEK